MYDIPNSNEKLSFKACFDSIPFMGLWFSGVGCFIPSLTEVLAPTSDPEKFPSQ